MAYFTPKEWKNRLVEFAGRRMLRNVATGESTVVDVTRNEGQTSQEGDAFSAANMNDLEQRVADGFTQVSSDFEDRLQGDVRIIPEGSGADTKYYAQLGADAASKKLLGSVFAGVLEPTSYNTNAQGSANFDLKPFISNYGDFTIANMCIEVTYFKGDTARVNDLSMQDGTTYNSTYNASTGILTVSGIATVNYAYKNKPTKIKLVVLQDAIQ